MLLIIFIDITTGCSCNKLTRHNLGLFILTAHTFMLKHVWTDFSVVGHNKRLTGPGLLLATTLIAQYLKGQILHIQVNEYASILIYITMLCTEVYFPYITLCILLMCIECCEFTIGLVCSN